MSIPLSILRVFERFRMPTHAADRWLDVGSSNMLGRLNHFISSGSAIKFSMLGYPFKSPNHRDKTLSDLPDLAESLSLRQFEQFSTEVQALYAPGVQISLVSDGFAFNEEFRVHPTVVDRYNQTLREWSSYLPIRWFTMRDFYPHSSITDARKLLIQQWAPSIEELERRILFDQNVNWLYRGMLRFMDMETVIWPFDSNSARRRETKALVRRMMLLNEAYSALVQKELHDHIRLSMHKSDNTGLKFSFQLIPGPADRIWASPWHCLIVLDELGPMTMHKKDADQLPGVQVVTDEKNQPFFYRRIAV